MQSTRRDFLRTTALAGGAALALDGLGFLGRLPRVSADEAELDPKLVRIDTGIEPTVRLLEETPREKLLEEVAGRVKKQGLSYRELLAALLLAGVRNVQPRPSVGFKFHAVLVVNSAHLASLSSPDSDRWLPIFWALDQFKSAQGQTKRESGWRMGEVDESKVPPAGKARQAFMDAMNNWDEGAADAAAAGVARTCGMNEAFELFAPYGARDFRDIGHKAIFVANSFRTLSCVGWQHAEPVLRSLAYALLKHDGQNPAKADLPPDRSWRRHGQMVKNVRADWNGGKDDPATASALLSTLRTGTDEQASKQVAEMLDKEVSPRCIWDAIFAAAGEMVMRRPDILSLHAATTSNALRYCYEASGDNETRLRLLLQNAAFLPMFRRGKLEGPKVDEFEPVALEAKEGEGGGESDALSEIFDHVGRDRMAAAGKALSYLKDHPDPKPLIDTARRLIFLKGTNSHDYKFSSAVLEDYQHVSGPLRARFLAASTFLLRGSRAADSDLPKRIRAALET
jgi:hypothetical protein